MMACRTLRLCGSRTTKSTLAKESLHQQAYTWNESKHAQSDGPFCDATVLEDDVADLDVVSMHRVVVARDSFDRCNNLVTLMVIRAFENIASAPSLLKRGASERGSSPWWHSASKWLRTTSQSYGSANGE